MPADRSGYAQLERWATGHGRIVAFGIEGNASYGAGVTSYIRCQGHAVIEVNRPTGVSGAPTAREMLIVAGDDPGRVRSESACAKLCGVRPVPASSGKTTRHRLNRGGHRQAKAALYRTVIVRLRFHQPTIDYVVRRTAEGKTKAEIIRCLKRYVAREIWGTFDPRRHPTS